MMAILLVALLLSSAAHATGPQEVSDPWAKVRFLIGEWAGESEGEPGKGTARRSYRFVLEDRFIEERNVSTYPPQPKNEKGEVHEHRSFFSQDRARRKIVLRQFHQEGFVNQYVVAEGGSPGTVLFESEALENVPAGWKARETYRIVSPDEFVESFEIARAAGPFEVYSTTRFRRTRP